MKRTYVLIISALLISLLAFTYADLPFIQKLKHSLLIYNIRYPEEKIYVSTDKTFYKPGETIWVSAFVVNGSDNKFTSTSEIMHMELIDPKGNVEQLLNLKLDAGVGKADFFVGENKAGGIYKIRAYTNYMKLLNPKNYFEKTIQIQSVLVPKILMKLEFERRSYSSNDTVVADLSAKSIENQSLSKQEYTYTVMLSGKKLITNTEQLSDSGDSKVRFVLPGNLQTNDGLLNITIQHKGNTESISRSIPIVLNKIDLQFYPEGGYCVEKVKTRVAFKALNEFGKPADIEGSVLDENNTVVAKFKSFHDGMGAFEFLPLKNKKYRAIINKPENIAGDFDLPEIVRKGFVMNVFKESGQLKIRINSPGKENVHLVAQTKGIIQYTKSFRTIEGENNIEISTLDFPAGISQITLFDGKEEAVCTRLVFLNKQKIMNISITTDKQKYAPREKVKMKIHTTDENNKPIMANIALSVVDDKVYTFADDKQDNILSYLLLSSDVKGKIEDPAFYFKNDEPKANEALDYLLMTQGWKRFAWKKIFDQDIVEMPDFTKFSEKFSIRGNLVTKYTKEPVGRMKVWINAGDTVLTNLHGYFCIKTANAYPGQLLKFQTEPEIVTNLFINGYSAISTYLDHKLVGMVYDAENNEPLSDVKILLSKNREITNSESDGSYHFYKIDNTQDKVIFSKAGYKTKEISVEKPIVNCLMEKEDIALHVAENELNKDILKQEVKKDKSDKNKTEIEQDEVIAENEQIIEPNYLPDLSENTGLTEELTLNNQIADELVISMDREEVDLVYESYCIQERPLFPGGENELLKFITSHVRYPASAIESGIEGTVYIRFLINKLGQVEQSIVMRSVDPSLEQAALEVVNNMPRFSPGKQNGNPVCTWFIIPVKFRLDYDNNRKDSYFNNGKYDICILSDYTNNFYPAKIFKIFNYNELDTERDNFQSTIFWNASVKTDKNGEAEISFTNNEDESTFVALAEGLSSGGMVGRAEYRYHTQMSFSIDAKIPVYLSFYDRVQIPVNLVNNTDKILKGNLEVIIPECFRALNTIPEDIEIMPNSNKMVYLEYETGNVPGTSFLKIAFDAGGLSDYVSTEINIAPSGFPQSFHLSGNQWDLNSKFVLPEIIDGSLHIEFRAFPSIFADLAEGIKGMIQEPHGCFEQTSSSTYPNILALQLMKQTGFDDDKVVQAANKYIDLGYKRLTTFETPKKGYEWYGNVPPHEGLTAYGLMEFVDMKNVYPQVDDKMVERTALWLTGRRDGKGGFRNEQPSHYGWGSHTTVQNAYIVYALSEAGYKNLEPELNAALNEALKSQDVYRMALIDNALFNFDKTEKAQELLNVLITKVNKYGFSNLKAEHSVTYSWGEALQIETCSLVLLAMMKSENPDVGFLEKGLRFLFEKRNFGRFGSTQSTILALKAMSKYFMLQAGKQNDGSICLSRNNSKIAYTDYTSGYSSILTFKNLESHFKTGLNYISVSQNGDKSIPFSFTASWYTLKPVSDEQCMLDISTNYATLSPKIGETVRLNVYLTNKTKKGLPNGIAKIGIPSGLSLQPWQLKEMLDKKLFDFYEVNKNYLILYYNSFNPNETKEIKLDLKAEVPGTYNCPANCAYLYYTDEFKSWCGGEKMVVEK